MKITIKSIIFALVLSLAGGCSMTACKSTPQRIEYNTEKTTQVSVEIAMSAWNSYVKSDKATLDQERKVKTALSKYRSSATTAHDLMDAYISISAAGNDAAASTAAQLKADAAMIEAAKMLSDLVNLLRSFGVSIK